MSWEQIKGNREQAKGEAKTRSGKLTDDDLATVAEKHDKLTGRLQELYGVTKEEAQRQVDELS